MSRDHSPARRSGPIRRDVVALLTLAAAACVVWDVNIIRSGESLTSLTNFDLYSEFHPRHSFAGEAFRNGHLPLWDPHQIAGLPFLATYQGGVLYPPNLLYAVLPTGFAMGLLGLLHVIAAGFAMYLLCREFERSRTASFLAALIFMLGGATLFQCFHTNAISSVPWLPAAVYCASRLARSANIRWALLLGSCIALQFLAGREFTFVMTVHTLGLFVAFQVAWMLRDGLGVRRAVRHLAHVAIGAVLAGGLVAAQALPTLALAAESGRTMAGLEGTFLDFYDPMPPAFFLANLVNPARGVIRREYFGWIPLVCFVFGFRLWGRDRPAVFASLLSLLAVALCFGSQTLLYAAYRALPLGATFRLPDRFIFLFAFGIALLAASGLDRLLTARSDLRPRWRDLAPRSAVVLGLGITLAFVLDSQWFEAGLASAARPWSWFASYDYPSGHFAFIGRAIAYFAAAAGLLAVSTWRAGAREGGLLRIAILLFATADLGFALRNPFLHPAGDDAPALAGASCYARVAEFAGPFGRHLIIRSPKSYALKDKDGELFSRFSATHYDPLVTRRQAAYFAALQEGGTPFLPENPWTKRSLFMGFLSSTPSGERMKLLDLLGTRVVLVDARRKLRPPGLDAFLGRLRNAGRCGSPDARGGIPIDLYVNAGALPRAFIVHDATGVASPAEALRRLVAPSFDPRREAVVEGTPPPLAPEGIGGPSRVEILSYEATRVSLRVETAEAGLLVLTDSYDPEWVATRNGEDVPIHPTDALFRGVLVPAGRSDLVFRYRPRRFHRGVAISATTAVLGALLCFRTRSQNA